MRGPMIAPVWWVLGFLAVVLYAGFALAKAALALFAGLCIGLALLCAAFWLLTWHPPSLDAASYFLVWGLALAAAAAVIDRVKDGVAERLGFGERHGR